jgi:hypothetical protein
MPCVVVAALAVVSLALDSVSVSRKSEIQKLSASSRKEKDPLSVTPIVSVLVDPEGGGAPSAREEGTSTTPGPAASHEAGAVPFDDHELTMLQQVGFKQAEWTRGRQARDPSGAGHDEMHEEHDASRGTRTTQEHIDVHRDYAARRENAEAATTGGITAPAHPENADTTKADGSSVVEVRGGAVPDATDTQEVPYYFFNFPVSVKFTGVSGGGPVTLVVLDRLTLFTMPYQVVFVYPIVLFALYTCVWGICCMRSNRTGLSFRLICEAAACFMCLWADLATKHKVITATRAWSYIVVMITLLTGWNVATIVTHGGGSEDLVFYTFQALVVVAWLAYAAERMFVRKYYRRTVDPMAGDHYCADCAANLCCGQFTALQEAQFMAEVSVEDTLGKHGSGGKW